MKPGPAFSAGQGRLLSVIPLLAAVFLYSAACGPSKAELARRAEMARLAEERRVAAAKAERDRLAAEAAARAAAEAARRARLQEMEKKGDAALRIGDVEAAVSSYADVLREVQGDAPEEQRLREKTVKAAAKAPPAVPEEARRHAVRAQTLVKTEQDAGYAPAAAELAQAVLAAPWWRDGYYNLGLMQEGAKDYAAAARSLRLCLLADPGAPDAEAVQNKVYELEVLQEQADKVKAMAGTWTNPKSGVKYEVTMDGNNFFAKNTNGYVVRAVKTGDAVDGTVTVPSTKGWNNNNCWMPEYTVPVSGKIRPDGSIHFQYMSNNYDSNFWQVTGSGPNNTGHRNGDCISVNLTGTSPEEINLVR